jgi:ABC-type multidrug transport system fused ATPase/permease subunit
MAKTLQSFIEDEIPIEFRNVTFKFPGGDWPVFKNLNLSIPQGSLVGIVGGGSSGKSTLLHLLGQVYVVDLQHGCMGDVLTPSHLRVLHVSSEVQLLAESVADNLFFGIRPTKQRARDLPHEVIERGLNILRLLDASEKLIDLAGDLEATAESVHSLSRSDRKLIHLARALVYNPEIMIIHAPTAGFDRTHQHHIIDVLRTYVDEKGVLMDPRTRVRRRPRTCIFSTGEVGDLEQVEMILLCKDGNVVTTTKANIESSMVVWKEQRKSRIQQGFLGTMASRSF